jgi:hypothetical protein
MAEIATWIFFPSFALTLIAGMLAIAVNPAYHNAGWAWVKLATGILVLSGNLQALGPIQVEAKRSAGLLARQLDPESITGSGGGFFLRFNRECRVWRVAAAPRADSRTSRQNPKAG